MKAGIITSTNGPRNLPAENNEYLDDVFFALSDQTRRGVLKKLRHDEASVSELAEAYALTLPGMLKHLGILSRAGLVRMEKDGRVRRCSIDPKGMERVAKYVEEYQAFWSEQFDRIESYLKK
jgi:DNA-binding transcriptional ArsR family regulator